MAGPFGIFGFLTNIKIPYGTFLVVNPTLDEKSIIDRRARVTEFVDLILAKIETAEHSAP